jgi:hypothetical protein
MWSGEFLSLYKLNKMLKRVYSNRRNVDNGGGVKKAGSGGGIGMPAMLRRMTTTRASNKPKQDTIDLYRVVIKRVSTNATELDSIMEVKNGTEIVGFYNVETYFNDENMYIDKINQLMPKNTEFAGGSNTYYTDNVFPLTENGFAFDGGEYDYAIYTPHVITNYYTAYIGEGPSVGYEKELTISKYPEGTVVLNYTTSL